MTVSTSYSPLSYSGNAATTAFPVTWQFFDSSLVVTLISSAGVETIKTLTTHYTVDGGTDDDGLPATGTVTMLSAPASGETLRITRATPKIQDAEWGENDSFPQKTIEAAFDRDVLIGQEVSVLDGSGAPQIRLPYLELKEQSSVTTPSSGYGRLYEKTDGDLYFKNAEGLEVSLSDQPGSAAASAAAAAASAVAAAASAASVEDSVDEVEDFYNLTVANYVQPASTISYEHVLLDSISGSFNGATTAFSLLLASVAFTPASAAQLIVHLNGVYQLPGTDYTIASSTITFTTAPLTGSTCSILSLKTAAGVLSVTPTTFMSTLNTTANDAAGARTQLGSGATGDSLFTAATSSTARTTLGTRTSAIDSIAASFNGSTTAFNLTVSASAFTPRDVYGIACIYNGVAQIPGSAFTVSGSQITFTFTPASGDSCSLWAISA